MGFTLALLSGLCIQHCHEVRCSCRWSLDRAWRAQTPGGAAQIGPKKREFPYAPGTTIKRKKKKKKKKRIKVQIICLQVQNSLHHLFPIRMYFLYTYYGTNKWGYEVKQNIIPDLAKLKTCKTIWDCSHHQPPLHAKLEAVGTQRQRKVCRLRARRSCYRK